MKRWLLTLMLSLLLTGCLLDGFDLPAGYRPAHPGAVAPLADRTVLHAQLDPVEGGDVYLRFFGTGPTSYVVEKFTVLPDGETAALSPAHVRFVPLDADHYALYWQMAAVPEQGYAVVRFDAGRMIALAPPADEAAVIALGGRHGLAATNRVTGGFALDATDESRVLVFLAALAARQDLRATVFSPRADLPPPLHTATLAGLGAHGPRLKRADLGEEASAQAFAAYAQMRAADGGGFGHYLVARLAANGWGMAADSALAIREAEAAMRQGVPEAGHVIAAVHYHGLGVPADPVRAYPFARNAAEAGSPAAMALLGLALRDGRGVARNEAEARRWFRRAADAGHAPAHALWADLVLADQSAEGDRAAIEALDAGIAQDDVFAYSLRGFMHENGRGGPRDLAAATTMFLAAAERGDAYAKFLAGERLRFGQGIAQDIPRGRALLAAAAQAGIADARAALERPDPAPQAVKKGCVEDWCKQALAVTDAHIEDLKLRMRKLRAELRSCPKLENPNLSCSELEAPPPASTSADGSPRVVYFFAYGCAKCAKTGAFIKAWSDRRGVFVYRIPAIWGAAVNADMAGAYYALKALGVADALDGKMFEAVRGGRFRSWTVEEFVAFATANGVAESKARAAFGGPMKSALDNARDASRLYPLAAVPALFVNGRYQIGLGRADAQTLTDLDALLDELLAQEAMR